MDRPVHVMLNLFGALVKSLLIVYFMPRSYTNPYRLPMRWDHLS